jgi:hypothetical protein
MKRIFRGLVLGAVVFFIGIAPHAQAKVVKKKAAPAKSTARTGHGGTVHPIESSGAKSKARSGRAPSRVARVSRKAGKRGRYKQAAAAPPVATWRRGQMEPSPDRYREIQQALASKGYLKTEPTGSWDSESQDALRRFQADQKLDPSGGITAKSLIALGLGPAKQ